MAASASKPVVRKPPVAKAAPKAPKAAPKVVAAVEPKAAPTPKPPAAPKAAAKAPTGQKVRGNPTIPAAELKLDRRNPFGYDGRIHAFFQAFLDGKGTATLDEMTQTCVDLSETYGITDTREAIRRDLLNQVWNWSKGKWGLTVTRDPEVRSRYTCTHVKGVPWAEAVGRKRA